MARNGSTRRWREFRAIILARDPYCMIRGQYCTNISTCVDHIIPLSRGGARYDPSNTQGACVSCNRWKSDRIDHDESFTTITNWLE